MREKLERPDAEGSRAGGTPRSEIVTMAMKKMPEPAPCSSSGTMNAAKGASGGRIQILKGVNHDGVPVDGAVGKCFAYGAQAGLFVVQGDADTRAGIRLSGADLVIGGRLRAPLHDELGQLAARANVKGFAFEYMTSGRGLVLGDPGPWLCSGMTGGVVYLLVDAELGLTEGALRCYVRGRPDHSGRLGDRRAVERTGDPEVEHLDRTIVGDHYVGGLDVAVEDPGVVR